MLGNAHKLTCGVGIRQQAFVHQATQLLPAAREPVQHLDIHIWPIAADRSRRLAAAEVLGEGVRHLRLEQGHLRLLVRVVHNMAAKDITSLAEEIIPKKL